MRGYCRSRSGPSIANEGYAAAEYAAVDDEGRESMIFLSSISTMPLEQRRAGVRLSLGKLPPVYG
jgi:hypothetical protein